MPQWHARTRRKGDRWWVACPAGPAPPAHEPRTHIPGLLASDLRGPQVWMETSSLKNTLQSSQSWDSYLLCAFVLLFLDQKSTAKSGAGVEPLKADLQLTGMITQNHSYFPKMLNTGFFVLLFLAYAAVTCSYIHSRHGASALSPFPLLFHMASLYTHHAFKDGHSWSRWENFIRIQATMALHQTTQIY